MSRSPPDWFFEFKYDGCCALASYANGRRREARFETQPSASYPALTVGGDQREIRHVPAAREPADADPAHDRPTSTFPERRPDQPAEQAILRLGQSSSRPLGSGRERSRFERLPGEDLLFRDDALRASVAQEGERPVEEDRDPVLEARQRDEMDDEPRDPGDEARRA